MKTNILLLIYPILIYSILGVIIPIDEYKSYYIKEGGIYYYYSYNIKNFTFNIQCDSNINIYYFNDSTKIKKHFNGSYSNYIEKKNGNNILFNILNEYSYFVAENSAYCYFYNYLVPYQIPNGYNTKLNFRYEINYPLKIEFENLDKTIYLNVQFKNYQYAFIYENNIKMDYKLDNGFIKLINNNSYYIEYKIFNGASIYLNFYEHEINEVTFEGVNVDVMNAGKYYFFTKKGFKKGYGGIKIEKAIFPNNLLCLKIDNVTNIYEVDYKHLLDSTFDCIISYDILEYPILDKDSYFIFSMTAYVDFTLKLFSKNNDNGSDGNGNNDYNKYEGGDNTALLVCSIVFPFLFVFSLITLYYFYKESNKYSISSSNDYELLNDPNIKAFKINKAISFVLFLGSISCITSYCKS